METQYQAAKAQLPSPHRSVPPLYWGVGYALVKKHTQGKVSQVPNVELASVLSPLLTFE